MHLTRTALAGAVLVLGLATAAAAQTRGTGRLAGTVLDPDDKPIEGVRVAATKAGDDKPAFEVRTNRKGEWVIAGIAAAPWNLDFSKDGYEPKSISVTVSEMARIPPIEFAMTPVKPVVDPNVEIRKQLETAAAKMQAKDFAGARGIYEELLARYPEAHQLHPLIARTYAAEENPAKAIEHLRIGLEKDPDNVEVRLLLGNLLIEQGQDAEGREMLAAIDMSAVKDPVAIINSGITLLNEGKPAEAKRFFDQVIQRFPDQPDSYYYRALAHLQLQENAEAKADLEKYVSTAAPDAPELAQAKKILEQLK